MSRLARSRVAKSSLSLIVACLLAALPMQSVAQTTTPCVLGYTVGFFNGVWNTELEAMDGMNGLQDSIRQETDNYDDTYNHEDVGYQLFYNHTGSTVGAGKWQDVAEVFVQRANSLDPSGALAAGGFESVWEFLNTGGGGITGIMAGQSPALKALLNQFVSDFITAASSAVGYYTANPPTAIDYAAQDNALTTLAAAGRRLLLVAHSQGNLFVDPAYDFIQPVVGSTRVKAVQIAPASPTLRGQYILSDNDLVINALRLQGGPSTVQPNNIDIDMSDVDWSGHTLVATYLDATRNGRFQTQTLLSNALTALTAPSTCQVSVSPQSTSLPPGGSQTLSATVNPPPGDNVLATEYQWAVTGNAGGLLNGGVASLNTSSSTVTYQASATAPQAGIDKVSVTVLVTKTAGDYVNAETLSTASATLSIAQTRISVAASPASITVGATSALSATLTGFTNTANYSYLWTTTGAYGSLNGTGSSVITNSSGNVTSVCSTSPQNAYTSNSKATVNAAVTDTVTLDVYSAPNCPSANAAGSGTATITVTPASADPTPWLGAWQCVTSSGSTSTLTYYAPPFPTGANFNSPPGGTQLMFIQNFSNGGQSYGYYNFSGLQAWDSRYSSFAAATAANPYSTMTITNGILNYSLGYTCHR
jgi:hypothetical protein